MKDAQTRIYPKGMEDSINGTTTYPKDFTSVNLFQWLCNFNVMVALAMEASI